MAAEYSNVAAVSACTTCYLSWDHLGSVRLVTDQNGNVISRHDFMPFGEEITGMGRDASWGATADGIAQKFTGQQRDEGQAADFFYARYLYAPLARFMSPDPLSAGADLWEPQSWNGYAYVNNNPLSDVDLDGLGDCSGGLGACSSSSGATQQPGQSGGTSLGSGSGFTLWESGPSRAVTALKSASVALFSNVGSATDQILSHFPLMSQGAMDDVAAFTDVFSFGASELVGGWTGGNASYRRNSAAYRSSYAMAMAGSFFMGEGELSALRSGSVLLEAGSVRFSQNSIRRTFANGQSIIETVQALRSGAQIPEIRVFINQGKLYTLDNRRLLAASMAGVKIRARLATPAEILNEVPRKFNPIKDGLFIGIRGDR